VKRPVFHEGAQVGYAEEVTIGGRPEAEAAVNRDGKYVRVGLLAGSDRMEALRRAEELALKVYLKEHGLMPDPEEESSTSQDQDIDEEAFL
jgi:hypothetical protein